MMALRELLRPALRDLGHMSGVSTVRAWLQRVGRIVMFHSIDDRYPAATFEAQLEHLARAFTIVPLTTIVEQLSTPYAPEPAGQIALTFDDGLRNNYTVAYPILRRLGLPATFFVCPGLIERREWQWPHETAERLAALAPAQLAVLAQDVGAPANGPLFKEWMKTLPARVRVGVLGRLRQLTPDFVPTDEQRLRYDPMTWDELQELDPGLITIGSHTVTHPVLTSLGREEAAWEIQDSRRWLEDKLGHPVEYFCYPNGALDTSIRHMVRISYRAAVTADPGFVRQGADPYRLKRIPASEQPTLLTWRLHRPGA